MYLPIEPQLTNVQGWLAAAATVKDGGGEAHNVVIDTADPIAETETDAAILREVDVFLRGHHRNSLSGVANTIFPQSLCDRHGPGSILHCLSRHRAAAHETDDAGLGTLLRPFDVLEEDPVIRD